MKSCNNLLGGAELFIYIVLMGPGYRALDQPTSRFTPKMKFTRIKRDPGWDTPVAPFLATVDTDISIQVGLHILIVMSPVTAQLSDLNRLILGQLEDPTAEEEACQRSSREYDPRSRLTSDWETRQYDIVNAFVESQLDQEVYFKMPPGFTKSELCLRLLRALYGLRISPKLWFNLLSPASWNMDLRSAREIRAFSSEEAHRLLLCG